MPFLPAATARLFDERGNFLLYRQILPLDVPGLYFNGYNSSFFSPLNAEMAALWIAADLAGAVALPAPGHAPAVIDQLAFMDVATDTHHCRGGKIIPFSMHNVDEVLGDLTSTSARGSRVALAHAGRPLGVPPDHFHGSRPPAACPLGRDSRDGGHTGTSSRPVARRVAPRLNSF